MRDGNGAVSPSEPAARAEAIPFTIMDAMLVAAASALSAVLVRGVLSIENPPPMFPGFIIGRLYIAAFAGPFLLGPVVQAAQLIRLGRRSWTGVEWVWSAFGVGYALIDLSTHWVFGAPPWLPVWLVIAAFQSPYLAPGPIALACVLPRFVRGRGLPWSGWVSLVTLLLWSGIWLFLMLG